MHDFSDPPDGARPAAAVAFDAGGNMFGTTSSGGLGYGTVFQLTREHGTWTESIIHTFTFADGFQPVAEVTLDTAGNLFGTTENGGTMNEGTVFELSPSGSGWTHTILVNFPDGSNGVFLDAGVALDQAGNLYGATVEINNAIVFQLTPAGMLNTLYSFSGPFGAADAGPHKTLTIDSAGNLYGTTYAFGAFGLGSVFKLTRSGMGWTYTDLHDFTGGTDGGGPQSEVTLDANGNLYGTAQFGGTHNEGVVWMISPN